MSAIKRKLEDILESKTYAERIKFLIYTCGYSSEDAKDYAQLFEPTMQEA